MKFQDMEMQDMYKTVKCLAISYLALPRPAISCPSFSALSLIRARVGITVTRSV